MNIQKLVEFLDQYPTWFKVAITVVFALVAVGLFTLQQSKTSSTATTAVAAPASQNIAASVQKSSQSIAVNSQIQSLSAFHERRKALEGRFLELQEFLQRSHGEMINWEAYVADVSEQGTKIHLIVWTREASSELAGVALPSQFRVKAFSLQKGDLVRFSGVISSASSTTPMIDAEALELVHPKNGG